MEYEYEKLVSRMNPPRVVIDNSACENATVIKSLETEACCPPSLRSSVGLIPFKEHTSIELIGSDRPGLLSEICAVLRDLECNVRQAELWTHNARAAAVVRVTDACTVSPIEDPKLLTTIKEFLCNVLRGNNDQRSAKMTVSLGKTGTERRLHQIMFADRDYERVGMERAEDKSSRPQVAPLDCFEMDYTVVTMRSKDRPKLMFDTVCTLTDLEYVVFHGKVDTGNMEAYQEYYIRHKDGIPVSTEAEQQRITQCLEAAIERRASEGLELELRTDDPLGILSDITRIFRENGLTIKRAEISTTGGKVIGTFYVTDVSGHPVNAKTIASIRQQIGQTILRVKQSPFLSSEPPREQATGCLFRNFFKALSLQNFRLAGSFS
ncbi:ACT domain-containing protein ACR6-like protein isoform X1 [Cinnamomum micranthum f. kanehirae]|uniref:ACT domain-containing protein ACR n=1 Tax=Cinnamomum micranthum f. kanehirae TaxID=337451 RepID=A0A443NNI4_9MAGN|nr:ACT domain-containing protein ACR6-like protein isoform X1 [Cinnamomum micranthum f. kanehirae]